MNQELLLPMLTGSIAAAVMLIFFVGRVLADRNARKRNERLAPAGVETLQDALPLPPSQGWREQFDRDFNQLLVNSGTDVGTDKTVAWIMLCAVGAGVGMYLWRSEPWMALFGFLIGLSIPVGWLFLVANRRKRLIQQQMPDAIFLLSRSLRSGLAVEQGIQMLAQESDNPLAEELKRISEQVKLGLTVPVALQNASQRIGVIDFTIFASIMSLHRGTGGQLPLLLDRLAAGVRDRVQYHGQFRAQTALGRITAIALGVAVPFIFLWYVLFQPETVQIFLNTPGGISMLTTAFGLEIIGVIWLHQLLKTDE
jgi:tight adherence protein B